MDTTFTALGLFLSLSAAALQGQSVLVATGSAWKYLDNGVDQGANWILPDFDDSLWQQGPRRLASVIPEWEPLSREGRLTIRTPTIYFRKQFFVADPSTLTNLLLRVRRDDGVVVYLNGTEIWRNNMPQGPISFHTLSSGYVVGGPEETTFFQSEITPVLPLLNAGLNWLAAEVHQFDPVSSDLVFDLELRGNAVVTNLPPTMLLSPYPKHHALYPTDSDITFELDAAYVFDPDGSVTNVEFYANGVLVAQTTGKAIPPSNRDIKFTAAWPDAPNGTYALTAVAYDNQGSWTTSANTVIITVMSLPPPTVVITSPAPGAVFQEAASIAIQASTSDPAAIAMVQFFAEDSLIGTANAAPYGVATSALAPGWHELSAIVVGNGGILVTSAPVSIAVMPRLFIERFSTSVSLTWHGDGFLLEDSAAPGGPFFVIAGAQSGFSAVTSAPHRFYRLRKP